jgi:hypothetical protein
LEVVYGPCILHDCPWQLSSFRHLQLHGVKEQKQLLRCQLLWSEHVHRDRSVQVLVSYVMQAM